VRSDFERRLEESGMKWLGMQAIGNILHAYGVMGIKSDIVYESLENDAERIVGEIGRKAGAKRRQYVPITINNSFRARFTPRHPRRGFRPSRNWKLYVRSGSLGLQG